MLNTIKILVSKLMYLYLVGYKNIIKYKLKKGIYMNRVIKYYRTDKIILMNNSNIMLPSHPYHIVDQSPWPLALSGVLLSLTISAVLSFHGYVMGEFFLFCSFILLIWGMSLWFKDIITEASYLGAHTDKVQKGISLGVALFIVSEVFFFLSIFWAYFHSSLAPAIEIGSEWPPKGLEAVDASEVPTANTTILLSSGSSVTVSHHSLVDRLISWANYGSIATICMAFLFTGLQVLEYFGVSYTITDSVFGSTFFLGTGFHGYILLLLIIILFNNNNEKLNLLLNNLTFTEINNKIKDNFNNSTLILIDKNNKKFELNRNFLEWLVGFTDAEGNFSITLRDNPQYKINNLKDNEEFKVNNVFKYVNLTFQIGLHVTDLKTLKFIQKELRCGNISVSKKRCNYYISDYYSIRNIIIPLFKYFHLNSTKYSQYIVFKNAAELIYNKSHLTNDGLSKLIYLKSILNINTYVPNTINITDNWLLGFIEGDATFSTGNIYRPRLKFECHIKEEKLFIKIHEYFKKGKVVTYKRIRDKIYWSVILDISDIPYFKFVFIPLFKNLNFHTNKYLDFCNWCYIVDLYYLGYHLMEEGKILIVKIKSIMNKGRLTNLNKNLNIKNINIEVVNLLSKSSPYVIIKGKKCRRINNNKLLKPRNNKIVVINITENKESIYKSISEVARILKISRRKITSILNTGLIYKNYIFNLYK
jgi:cytochrome c oxidase subunit 3